MTTTTAIVWSITGLERINLMNSRRELGDVTAFANESAIFGHIKCNLIPGLTFEIFIMQSD